MKKMGIKILSKLSAFLDHLHLIYLNNKAGIQTKSATVSSNSLRTNGGGNIFIGKNTFIYKEAILMTYGGKIIIGDNVGINPYTIIYGMGKGVRIGNNVMIAAQSIIIPANHNAQSTSIPMNSQGISSKGIVIEDDVWIGAGVKILDGVNIGKGSIIGAGAIVTKNIPPYSIAVGIPAKIIKKR